MGTLLLAADFAIRRVSGRRAQIGSVEGEQCRTLGLDREAVGDVLTAGVCPSPTFIGVLGSELDDGSGDSARVPLGDEDA